MKRRLLNWGLRAAILLGVLAVALSGGGAWHPIGDSLAVFRWPIALGVLGMCMCHWRWRPSWIFAAVSVVVIAAAMVQKLPQSGGAADVVVYQKNMKYLAADRTEFLADVRASGADLVALQEVSLVNLEALIPLRDQYPYSLVCTGGFVGSVAILSQVPILDRDCAEPHGIAMVEVQLGGRVLQFVSLHQPWPWPFAQSEWLAERLPLLNRNPSGPTIVAGDLNMVPEGHSLEVLAGALGVRRVGHHLTTFVLENYPITIDHVMVTGGQGWVEQRPLFGSDHFGILAHLTLP